VGTPADKERLLALLYEARNAAIFDKLEAYRLFKIEVDRVSSGTPYSYQQVKQALLNDGYAEYARRRRLAERNTL
jgi:uncharacterized protein YqjF (DUF2071 family)